MARDLPPPTPEGVLIRRVRESIRPRLAVAAAAERAGISAEMWGLVERGYRTPKRDAEAVRIVAKPQTLAHMAYAVGLKPSDLEEVDRADAAAVLAEMRGPEIEVVDIPVDRGVVMVAVPPDLSEEDREEVRAIAENLAKYLHSREGKKK